MQYNLLQVIEFLNKIENKDRVFYRLNDEKFIVKRGHYGDILRELSAIEITKPMPIFLYMQDLFILKEGN